MTDQEAVKRMQAVERIVGEKVYQEAWDTIRAKLLHVMETTKDDAVTLKAKSLLGLMGDLQGYFRRVMEDGRVAVEQIKLDAERKKRKSWF